MVVVRAGMGMAVLIGFASPGQGRRFGRPSMDLGEFTAMGAIARVRSGVHWRRIGGPCRRVRGWRNRNRVCSARIPPNRDRNGGWWQI